MTCAGLAGKGDFNELMSYSTQAGYKPDYLYLMQRLMMDNPEAAVNLAKMIAKQPGPPMDLNMLADLFLQRNAVREATAFLLDVLQENKPEHDKLQTKVRRTFATCMLLGPHSLDHCSQLLWSWQCLKMCHPSKLSLLLSGCLPLCAATARACFRLLWGAVAMLC